MDRVLGQVGAPMITPLEPTAIAECEWCPWSIEDEESVVDDAVGEHMAMHARLARRTDRCSTCSCHVDEHTAGCSTCHQRHRSRRRKQA